MGNKTFHDDVYDNGLSVIVSDCDMITVCETKPTNYTEAHATNVLVSYSTTSADFTLGAGATSGRTVVVGDLGPVTVTTTGDTYFVCLLDTSTSRILALDDATPQTISSGNSFSVATFNVGMEDPA